MYAYDTSLFRYAHFAMLFILSNNSYQQLLCMPHRLSFHFHYFMPSKIYLIMGYKVDIAYLSAIFITQKEAKRTLKYILALKVID